MTLEICKTMIDSFIFLRRTVSLRMLRSEFVKACRIPSLDPHSMFVTGLLVRETGG